jgi:hypothetical protein
MAGIQCEEFVKNRLKAPSTADFPFLDRTVIPEGANTYIVRSYVDAQNGFGAMIRSDFRCEIRYNGGEDADITNWTLVSLSLDP